MSATESTMMPLGTKAPDFELSDVITGNNVSLETFMGKKALLVMFICRHCQYVQNAKDEIARLGSDYHDKDVGVVAISSNDPEQYPEDAPESLSEFAEELELAFPLLYDETQEVAKAYTAACTPDFFLFDKDMKLVYRGQLDDSRPGNNIPVTGKDMRQAIDAVLEGRKAPDTQKPSSGCNIKWKPGNEPDYFG